jgi:hypothetical protein
MICLKNEVTGAPYCARSSRQPSFQLLYGVDAAADDDDVDDERLFSGV